jgi:hypothetical protein
MPISNFLSEIRDDISNDRIAVALQKLKPFIGDSPLLNEALQQSGRFAAIQQQIRLGVVSHKESTLAMNQIRAGILELISEISALEESHEDIKQETTQAAARVQINQQAEKIYNIQHIDKADFS